MVSAPGSGRKVEAHPRSTSEPSRRLTVHLEANPLVEPQRVRVRDQFDIARARSGCACRDVVDEQSADSQSHRIRLHKQVIELAPAVPDRQHHREAKTAPCSVDGNSHDVHPRLPDAAARSHPDSPQAARWTPPIHPRSDAGAPPERMPHPAGHPESAPPQPHLSKLSRARTTTTTVKECLLRFPSFMVRGMTGTRRQRVGGGPATMSTSVRRPSRAGMRSVKESEEAGGRAPPKRRRVEAHHLHSPSHGPHRGREHRCRTGP